MNEWVIMHQNKLNLSISGLSLQYYIILFSILIKLQFLILISSEPYPLIQANTLSHFKVIILEESPGKL